MGFDNPRESLFKIKVSDTQAYRQFGNAVVVPVVRSVARHMFPHILSAVNHNKKVQAVEYGWYCQAGETQCHDVWYP